MADVDIHAYEQGLQELQRQFARDALRIIVARAEALEFDSLTADVWKEVVIPWDRGGENTIAAILDQLLIFQTGGLAANFDWKILTKAGGSGLDELDSAAAQVSPMRTPFPPPGRIFLSEAVSPDDDKIVLAIKPNGAIGSYKARIYAKPGR